MKSLAYAHNALVNTYDWLKVLLSEGISLTDKYFLFLGIWQMHYKHIVHLFSGIFTSIPMNL